jgi:hypothetical protein
LLVCHVGLAFHLTKGKEMEKGEGYGPKLLPQL